MSVSPACRLAPIVAVAILSGCMTQTHRQVSWSKSGDEIAFPSGSDRIDVYSIKRNDVRPLPNKNFQTVVWSPTEERLAAYYKGKVYLYEFDGDKFSLVDDYRIAWGKDEFSQALINWHPSGRRLLVAPLDGPDETFEIDIDSRAKISIGRGAAIYGPGADWLLWNVLAYIGRGGKKIVDRQSYPDLWNRYPRWKNLRAAARETNEDSLPMDDEVRDELEASGGPAYNEFSGYGGEMFCLQRTETQAARLSVDCLESDGSLEQEFSTPTSTASRSTETRMSSRGPQLVVAPDPSASYFAVAEDLDEARRRLRVFDRSGAVLADGEAFVARIAGARRGLRSAHGVCPSLLWSQDHRWLSCFLGDNLYLWGWRTGEIRVVDVGALTRAKR